jgi:hypothetical protein
MHVDNDSICDLGNSFLIMVAIAWVRTATMYNLKASMPSHLLLSPLAAPGTAE